MDEIIKAKEEKEAWRKVYPQFCKRKIPEDSINLQNVFTPYELCYDIIRKLEDYSGNIKGKTFLIFNLEFAEVLCYDFGVPLEWILFVTDCKEKIKFARSGRYKGLQTELMSTNEFLTGEWDMKFDCALGNPPYQTKSNENNKKTQSIWGGFVTQALSVVKENGYVCFVHPSSWRKPTSKLFEIIKSKKIHYLEIHNEQDGVKTFGATTRYDWYILQNKSCQGKTIIKGQDGIISNINLCNIPFIPNSLLDKNFSFIAKEGEETVNLIANSSYHHQRIHMSNEKHHKFIYPVIYSTPVKNPTIWYSSTNTNGHFGISKFIFNPSRPIGFVVDETGKYGMSEFCTGIIGDVEYLKIVQQVFENQKSNGFSDLMESCHFTSTIFNKHVISTFRKDFWKEFI